MKRIATGVCCVLLFGFAGNVAAQTEGVNSAQISPENMERFHIMEDSMLVTIDSAYNAFIPDTGLTTASVL